MSIERSIGGIKEYLKELQKEAIELPQLDETQAKELVELDQEVHDTLAVIFDKFDIEVGDERQD